MCHAPGPQSQKIQGDESHKNTLKVFTFDSEKLYISVQIKSKSKASSRWAGKGADSIGGCPEIKPESEPESRLEILEEGHTNSKCSR